MATDQTKESKTTKHIHTKSFRLPRVTEKTKDEEKERPRR